MTKNSHRNKNRSSRKHSRQANNKKQLSSLEKLEQRQVLSGDSLDFTFTLTEGPNSYQSDQSYSYAAPWTYITPTVQGSVSLADWAANQSGNSNEIHDTADYVIKTTDQYRDALVNGRISEVSEDLVACFYYQDQRQPDLLPINTLYSPTIINAWVGSSDNLYSLLVLNQRFPKDPTGLPAFFERGGNGDITGSTGVALSAPSQSEDILNEMVSDKALQGLSRIVGFPFMGAGSQTANPNPTAASAVPQLAVFNRSHGSFTNASNSQDTISSLSDYVPTLLSSFQFTNDLRPAESPALPQEVLWHLLDAYSSGFDDKMNPIEIFSGISGIPNLEQRIAYNPNSDYQVYDAYNQPIQDLSNPNYDAYREACDTVHGYYLNSGKTNQWAIHNFFKHFVDHRIVALESLDPTTQLVEYETTIEELAIGFRALMAMTYDASPLWSSYGTGYSNAAHPLIGKSYDVLSQPENHLQIFSGQEFQLLNIEVPPNFLNITAQTHSPHNPSNPTSYPTYPSQGWFKLLNTEILTGVNIFTDATEHDYQTKYDVIAPGTTAIMPAGSLSSDTLSAAGVLTATPQEMLTPTSLVTIGDSSHQISELQGFVHSDEVLPDFFATYISLAGGIDLVTGSPLADVIVGPGHGTQPYSQPFHGRLTVDAGSGDDVVAPGRGGSLVQLGPGADSVVFESSDLFGEANFVDFNYGEGDRLYITDDIHPQWEGNTLVLRGLRGGEKTLRLTAMSDDVWNKDVIYRIPTHDPSTLAVGTGGSVGSQSSDGAGIFNYLETHQFVLPSDRDVSSWTLEIESNNNSKPLPYEIWVTVGNNPQKSTLSVNKHSIPLSIFEKQIDFISARGASAFQISVTPYDTSQQGQKFGNRQAQVFISRYDGERTTYAPDVPWGNTIKTSDLGTPQEVHSPKTKWRKFKEANGKYAVAYVGGLANVILDTNINATSTSPTTPGQKPLQITVDTDFSPGVGYNAYNLSTRMAVWSGLEEAAADGYVQVGNGKSPGSTDYPQGLLPSSAQIVSLATDQPVVVNGTGRISGYEIISYYGEQSTYTNLRNNSDPFYFINSDLLAITSVHQTDNRSDTDWAVDISGITTAWGAHRGDASVFLQDYNGVAYVEGPPSDPTITFPTGGRAAFENSKAKIYDFKQSGNWVDQSDGPKIASWHSQITNSFIHSNDDSIKVQAPYFYAKNNTILQGNAGNAVGYAYGFINSSASGSVVDYPYIHRVYNDNGFGLVAMRIIPNQAWQRYDQFEGITVSNLFVPSFNKAGDDGGFMNTVALANVLLVGVEARGFAPAVNQGDPSFEFQVGGVDTSQGWTIYADTHLSPQASQFYLGDQPGSPYISISQPRKNADGTWTFSKSEMTLLKWDPINKKFIQTEQPNPTIATVTQNTSAGPIKLYQKPGHLIRRPKLHRSSKIYINRESTIGPTPIRLVHSDLVAAASYHATAGEESFVVSGVANGSVEKKLGDSWVNVSEAPKSSNPFELLALLQRRLISPSDEIRWVPSADDSTKATAEAFSIFGWNGKDKLSSDKASVISFEAE